MSFNIRRIRILTIAIVAMLLMGIVTTAFAQVGSPVPPLKPKKLSPDGNSANLISPYGAKGQVSLLVEFQGAPAAVVYADKVNSGAVASVADAAAASAVSANSRQQAAAASALKKLGAQTLYSVQRVLNAVVVRVDASKVRDIEKIPGVTRVSLAPRNSIDNAHSVPFIGANTVWDSTGALSTHGLTGQGITVAVIDTGVDYIHKNFGGSGDYTGQDPKVINSDGVAFPTAKVVAGYDFVGNDYDAASDNPARTIPHPDPDPMDCDGHGSHTAGTVGGYGVQGGNTYTGGYDNLSTATINGFDIGPGVAPMASIVALKVFGCTGSTDVVVQAIEYATDPNGDGHFDDHYNVINMSLGSDFGFTGEETAITNATKAGVIVVASAGNAGDNHYIAGSPADTTEAISVAASIGAGQSSLTLDWDDNGDGSVDQSFFAIPQGWAPTPSTTTANTTLEMPSNDPDTGTPNGCNLHSINNFTGFTAGNVAYIYRGDCTIKAKAYNAQQAGASAVVIVAHNTNVPIAAADDPAVPATIIIPVVMISGDAGDIIEGGTFTGDKASINPAGVSLVDQIAGFSSRGPRRGNLDGLLLKPDITAPGFNIISTANGTGNLGVAESGTSMAAPHISGVMALLRQEHPTWTVAQLKALVMNTAVHDLFDTNLTTGAQEDKLATSRVGAGRVDVPLAADSGVIAYNTANPAAVSITFQTRDVLEGTTPTESQSITIENKGKTNVTYAVDTTALETVPGVTFSATPASVTVKPGKKVMVKVTASYNATAMLHLLDPGSLEDQGGTPRHWLTEATGYLRLIGPNTLRVPLYAAPRPASAMSETTTDGVIYTGATTGSVNVPLAGTDVNNTTVSTTPHSSYPQDYVSKVSAFQLQYSGARKTTTPQPWDSGEIQYVGVANDSSAGGDGYSTFGISTWGNWDTPNLRTVYLCLDLDQDHTGGVWGDGTDYCYVTIGDEQTDTQMVGIWDINGFLGGPAGALYSDLYFQNQIAAAYDTRIFDNNVFFMSAETDPALRTALAVDNLGMDTNTGGPDGSPAFDYFVYTQDGNDPAALAGLPTDSTTVLSYDPSTAPIHNITIDGVPTFLGTVAGAPITSDLNGSTFDFNYDLTSAPGNKVDLLFLHHYNAAGNRAQVVTVDAASGPPCTGLLNCNFETADSHNRPTDWKGTLKPGDVLTTSPVANGTKAFQFSGKSGTRTLYQDVVRSGASGDPITLTFYVDGSGLQTGDSAKVTLTFYNGNKAKSVAAFPITSAMGIGSQQTYAANAPQAFTKIRVTLSATLKATASKVVFDLLSLP